MDLKKIKKLLKKDVEKAGEYVSKTMYKDVDGAIPAKELSLPNLRDEKMPAKLWKAEGPDKELAGTSIGQGEAVRSGELRDAKEAALRTIRYNRKINPKLPKDSGSVSEFAGKAFSAPGMLKNKILQAVAEKLGKNTDKVAEGDLAFEVADSLAEKMGLDPKSPVVQKAKAAVATGVETLAPQTLLDVAPVGKLTKLIEVAKNAKQLNALRKYAKKFDKNTPELAEALSAVKKQIPETKVDFKDIDKLQRRANTERTMGVIASPVKKKTFAEMVEERGGKRIQPVGKVVPARGFDATKPTSTVKTVLKNINPPYQDELMFKKIPLEQIEDVAPWSEKKLSAAKELVKSGKMEPIQVTYDYKIGKYRIGDGIHRTAAAKLQGLKNILATIDPKEASTSAEFSNEEALKLIKKLPDYVKKK